MDNKLYTKFKNITKVQEFFQNKARFNRFYLFFCKQTINQSFINRSAECAQTPFIPIFPPFVHTVKRQLIAPQLMLVSRSSASLRHNIPNSGFSQLGSASMIFCASSRANCTS